MWCANPGEPGRDDCGLLNHLNESGQALLPAPLAAYLPVFNSVQMRV